MTVIVLCNNDSGSASTVARDIMAIYYGHPYEVPAPPVVAKVAPEVLDQYVGEYEVKPGVTLTITREGNGLGVLPTGGRKAEALPSSETRFFITAPSIVLTFFKDADGKVTHLVFTQGGSDTRARKIK